MRPRLIGTAALFASTLPQLAFAGPGEGEEPPALVGIEAEAEAEPDVEAIEGPGATRLGDRSEQPWIERWAPEPNMVELGIYGGILMPSPEHELFEPDLSVVNQGFEPLARIAPDVGLRVGYYPSRFVGLEAEGGVMPARLRDVDARALLYTIRGQVVLQLGLWSVTPFLLVGGGGLGVASDVLGNDIDPLLHFGGGLKFYLSRYVMLRLDVRDLVTHKRGVDEIFNAHNLEVLLGLSFTLGREKQQPVAAPEPVAVAPSDRDNDGIPDASDKCPDEAETFNDYLDEDGCPEFDSDNDGFFDDQDACPQKPEIVNGFQDEDGCPDEIPAEVKAFTGAIAGITFQTNSDVIRPGSEATLDEAVSVLKTYPDIRMLVVGHTDDRGDRDHNLELSRRRAEAVKTYLVTHGIEDSRITTEGRGPDEPIDTNKTKAGRANNRRIEFVIVQPQ